MSICRSALASCPRSQRACCSSFIAAPHVALSAQVPSPAKRRMSDTGSGQSCKENGAHAQEESVSPKIASAVLNAAALAESPSLQAVTSIQAADADTDTEAHLRVEQTFSVDTRHSAPWRLCQVDPIPAAPPLAEPMPCSVAAQGAFSSPVTAAGAQSLPSAPSDAPNAPFDAQPAPRSARHERPRTLHATPPRSPAPSCREPSSAHAADADAVTPARQLPECAPYSAQSIPGPLAVVPAVLTQLAPASQRRVSFMPRSTPFDERSQLRIGTPFHQLPTPANVVHTPAAASAMASSIPRGPWQPTHVYDALPPTALVPFNAPQHGVTFAQPHQAGTAWGAVRAWVRRAGRQRCTSLLNALIVALCYLCSRCAAATSCALDDAAEHMNI